MGAAGDMLTAALLELLPDPDGFINKLNSFGIPGVVYSKERCVKQGICGTKVRVLVNGSEEGEDGCVTACHEHSNENESRHSHRHTHVHADHEHHHGDHEHYHGEHEHHHGSMEEIEHIVYDHLDIPEKVKKDVLAVYSLIARAESEVHGVDIKDIHFHEVGTMDALADVVAVCMLMYELRPDKISASAVHVGSGHVKCAHGVLPVPAPATALILKGIPCYSSGINGELCTPTGAALLKYFVSDFGNMPVMKVNRIGYGMGTKDFETANCLRAMLGEGQNMADSVVELSCNVDDMTAEQIGFAIEALFEAGARDVFTVAAGMKKNRPGTLIKVICNKSDAEKMAVVLFKHTSTTGVRMNECARFILEREEKTVDTSFGEVRFKHSFGYGADKLKPEYDDVAALAKKLGVGIIEAGEMIKKEYER